VGEAKGAEPYELPPYELTCGALYGAPVVCAVPYEELGVKRGASSRSDTGAGDADGTAGGDITAGDSTGDNTGDDTGSSSNPNSMGCEPALGLGGKSRGELSAQPPTSAGSACSADASDESGGRAAEGRGRSTKVELAIGASIEGGNISPLSAASGDGCDGFLLMGVNALPLAGCSVSGDIS
jgi:hypothetical protein